MELYFFPEWNISESFCTLEFSNALICSMVLVHGTGTGFLTIVSQCMILMYAISLYAPIPVATRSKAWF